MISSIVGELECIAGELGDKSFDEGGNQWAFDDHEHRLAGVALSVSTCQTGVGIVVGRYASDVQQRATFPGRE